MIFLIQQINGRVKHDFSFALLEAIEYQNWYNNNHELSFQFAHSKETMARPKLDKMVPSGTLEFVFDFLHFQGLPIPAPLNIPEQLRGIFFTKRKCDIFPKEQLPLPAFIKSATKYKSFTDVVEANTNLDHVPNDTYFCSDLIDDIESEWRCFVFNNKLVGMNHYLGDFTMFPDVAFVQEAIEHYTDCPPAYTLDIGINKQLGNFIIEVHPLVSCGLYGFNNHKILPQMMASAFKWFARSGE